MLEVKKISKTFGGVKAVQDFSAYVNNGEIVGLIGPNGAGKTTVLNLISGITPIDSGEIILDGEKLHALNMNQIAKSGISRTFQNIRLFESLTAIENIMVAMQAINKDIRGRTKAVAHAKTIMQEFEWSEDYDILPKNLPYGLKRRLELIRAMSQRPKVLMLDEPAAGLNPTEINELIGFINHIKDEYNISIFVIEHRLELIRALCDRTYVMNYGRLLCEGKTDEILRNPDVIKAYIGEDD